MQLQPRPEVAKSPRPNLDENDKSGFPGIAFKARLSVYTVSRRKIYGWDSQILTQCPRLCAQDSWDTWRGGKKGLGVCGSVRRSLFSDSHAVRYIAFTLNTNVSRRAQTNQTRNKVILMWFVTQNDVVKGLICTVERKRLPILHFRFLRSFVLCSARYVCILIL